VILFLLHLREDPANLIHPLFSFAAQDDFIGGRKAFLLAEVDCLLQLRYFLFDKASE